MKIKLAAIALALLPMMATAEDADRQLRADQYKAICAAFAAREINNTEHAPARAQLYAALVDMGLEAGNAATQSAADLLFLMKYRVECLALIAAKQ
jgi:hypothetical protein